MDSPRFKQLFYQEEKTLESFFDQKIEIPVPNFSVSDLEKWQNLELDPHYLPEIKFDGKKDFPGWKEKPSKIFYQKIQQGKISQDSLFLPGKWILIDRRPKPRKNTLHITSANLFFSKKYLKKYQKQQYRNDFLLPILKKNGWQSRFSFSWNDYQKIKPEIAQLIGVEEKQIRLPRFIEFNYLGNAFYPEWGKTKTWEWLEDKHNQSCYLASGSGSFSIIGWDPPDFYSTILAFRPIIILDH